MNTIKKYCIYLLLIATTANASQNLDPQSLLENGISQGDMKMVQAALEHNADIHRPDASGSTPLIAAAFRGNTLLTQFLLDNGAQKTINTSDSDGITALQLALALDNAALITLLLSYGATSLGSSSEEPRPAIKNLMMIAGVIPASPEELAKIISGMSATERAQALTMMKERFAALGTPISVEQVQLFAMLGDKEAQKSMKSVREQIALPSDLSSIVLDYANPFYQETTRQLYPPSDD